MFVGVALVQYARRPLCEKLKASGSVEPMFNDATRRQREKVTVFVDISMAPGERRQCGARAPVIVVAELRSKRVIPLGLRGGVVSGGWGGCREWGLGRVACAEITSYSEKRAEAGFVRDDVTAEGAKGLKVAGLRCWKGRSKAFEGEHLGCIGRQKVQKGVCPEVKKRLQRVI